MKIEILCCGYCVHPEFVSIKGGRWGPVKFPSSVVLIQHPTKGLILFDTGYTNLFFENTKKFPEKLYALVTPAYINESDTAKYQLEKRGIKPDDVRHIILSHFHADHIAGLRDFPKANIVFWEVAYTAIKDLRGWRAVIKGILPPLIPEDIEDRATAYTETSLKSGILKYGIINEGVDIFDDGSVIGVPLPGHAPGHMGIVVFVDGQDYFFLGDSCWHKENFSKQKPPSKIGIRFLGDLKPYMQTLKLLQSFQKMHPAVQMVPCHCQSTIDDARTAINEPCGDHKCIQ